MKEKQTKLIEKHKPVLQLIGIISNQVIRQSQLSEILIQTNYVSNKDAKHESKKAGVSRLLKELEDHKLISRARLKYSREKIVKIRNAGLKAVSDKPMIKSTENGKLRSLRNAVRIEIFKRYFIQPGLSLSECVDNALNHQVSNLFTSNQNFYKELKKDQLALHSFNTKSATFFKQEAEIKNRLRQKRQHMDDNVRNAGPNKLREFKKSYWTLEDLRERQIYLIDFTLTEPTEFDLNDWINQHYSFSKSFEPLTLNLNFNYLILSSTPQKRDIVGNLMNIAKYVKRTFKFHHSYFQKDKGIQKAIVNVKAKIDLTLINHLVLDDVEKQAIEEWFEKKLKRYLTGFDFKYNFKIQFKQLGLNGKNEHITV